MRRLALVCLLSVAAVVFAGGVSKKQCKQFCAPIVDSCTGAHVGQAVGPFTLKPRALKRLTHRERTRCQRAYVKQCRQQGPVACAPSTTTTTTTTIAHGTTLTVTTTTRPYCGPYGCPVTTTAAPPRIAVLLGRWAFSYTSLVRVDATYDLTRLDTLDSNGAPVLAGENIVNHDLVIAGRVQDIDPGSTLTYEFALTTKGTVLCQTFLFDLVGVNDVTGEVAVYYADCSTPLFSQLFYPFAGRRQ